MEPVKATPAAVEAFQTFYLAELDSRIQRSEVVGAITLKKGNAALFYENETGKFTLVEKLPEVEEANVNDCVPREQWGRNVMLFGHATYTGGYIPSGHATLDANALKIKLASGRYYRIEVDATQAHLQTFVSAEPPKAQELRAPQHKKTSTRANSHNARQSPKPVNEPKARQHPVNKHSGQEDESEDLTAEDLQRLRGEIPLSSSSKKWKR